MKVLIPSLYISEIYAASCGELNPKRLSSRAGCGADFEYRECKVPLLRQAFMEAGKQFKAIDAPTNSVIVQYGAGKKLVSELCSVAKEFNTQRYYLLLRQAQKFSINVFPNAWEKLIKRHAVEEIQDGHGIYYLKEEYYSKDFGLTTEPSNQQAFYGV